MHIMCLESSWYKHNPFTVQPFLETLRLIEGVEYSHFPCNSIEELKQHLSIQQSYQGILYLAMHGRSGRVSFSETNNKKRAPLEDIADMMERRFEGWFIHFSNCSALKVSDNRYYDFKNKTGASVVSGYTIDTDFIVSYATDMLFLSVASFYKRKSNFIKHMYRKYPDLIKQSGLYIE